MFQFKSHACISEMSLRCFSYRRMVERVFHFQTLTCFRWYGAISMLKSSSYSSTRAHNWLLSIYLNTLTLILKSMQHSHAQISKPLLFLVTRIIRHATYVPASTASGNSRSGPPQTSEDIELGSWLGPPPSHFFRRCEFSPPPGTWSASDASESSAAAAAASMAAS